MLFVFWAGPAAEYASLSGGLLFNIWFISVFNVMYDVSLLCVKSGGLFVAVTRHLCRARFSKDSYA